jgi:hypothetical protein
MWSKFLFFWFFFKNKFSMNFFFNIHNFSIVGQNIMKPTWAHPCTSRAFHQYQELGKRHHGWEIWKWGKKKKKNKQTNKQTTFIDR